MLVEQTLFGEVDKVANAIQLLTDNEPANGYYLCFSGGKDSVVIYGLAARAGVKFTAYHNVTTVEPPELMKFIRDNYPAAAEIQGVNDQGTGKSIDTPLTPLPIDKIKNAIKSFVSIALLIAVRFAPEQLHIQLSCVKLPTTK